MPQLVEFKRAYKNLNANIFALNGDHHSKYCGNYFDFICASLTYNEIQSK